jgi:hypothetical protein
MVSDSKTSRSMLRQGRRIGVLGGIIVKKLGCQSCKSFQSPKGRQVKKLKLILCPGTPTAHLDRHVLRCVALCSAVETRKRGETYEETSLRWHAGRAQPQTRRQRS